MWFILKKTIIIESVIYGIYRGDDFGGIIRGLNNLQLVMVYPVAE